MCTSAVHAEFISQISWTATKIWVFKVCSLQCEVPASLFVTWSFYCQCRNTLVSVKNWLKSHFKFNKSCTSMQPKYSMTSQCTKSYCTMGMWVMNRSTNSWQPPMMPIHPACPLKRLLVSGGIISFTVACSSLTPMLFPTDLLLSVDESDNSHCYYLVLNISYNCN